jgi:hypothetical protein
MRCCEVKDAEMKEPGEMPTQTRRRRLWLPNAWKKLADLPISAAGPFQALCPTRVDPDPLGYCPTFPLNISPNCGILNSPPSLWKLPVQ